MGYHDIFKGTNYFVVVLVLISASTVCNSFLLFVIAKAKNLQTTPNFFISSIALANTLSGIFNGISISVDTLGLAHQPLWCSILLGIDRSLLAAGVFSLVGLCIDRYRFYVGPTTYKCNKKAACQALAYIWSLSLAYGVVLLTITLSITRNGLNIKDSMCSLFDEYPHFNANLRIVDFIIVFSISACTIIIAFYKIHKNSWNHHVNNMFTIQNHKKSLRLLLSVAILQWSSGVPFYIYEISHDLSGSFSGINVQEATEDVWKLCTVLLAVLSSIFLPLIYFVFSDQIRFELKNLLTKNMVHPGTEIAL